MLFGVAEFLFFITFCAIALYMASTPISVVFKLIAEAIKALPREKNSRAGIINIVCDGLVALLILSVVLPSSLSAVIDGTNPQPWWLFLLILLFAVMIISGYWFSREEEIVRLHQLRKRLSAN